MLFLLQSRTHETSINQHTAVSTFEDLHADNFVLITADYCGGTEMNIRVYLA